MQGRLLPVPVVVVVPLQDAPLVVANHAQPPQTVVLVVRGYAVGVGDRVNAYPQLIGIGVYLGVREACPIS